MRRCRLLLLATEPLRALAEATSSWSACAMVEPRRRRTKDGRSFLFDPCSNAWRLEAEPEPSEAPLALPWSQFNVSFHGDFRIGGIPMLLGDDPQRRPKDHQDHADTGSSIWDGAVALAKVLEQQPFLVRGREVLELGAGRGLSGLAAWALGARKVQLTDLPYAVEAMEIAVQLTCAGHKEWPKPEVAELDWLKAEEFFENRDTDLDVILAADVVWLMDLVEPLADAIATVAKYHPKVEVLVVHQTRSANVELAFLKAMETRSFGQPIWTLPGGPAESHLELRWHEDFVPDQRIKLWCFKLQTEGAKERDAVAVAC